MFNIFFEKNNSNIDHKQNVESKSIIIEKLKNLITEDSSIEAKYKIFNQLKKSWTELVKYLVTYHLD